MKKITIFCSVVLLSLCGFSQVKKAAVISVFGNKNLSDNPLDTKMYEALLKDSSFDISGTVGQFEGIIQENLIPSFPFPFESKEVITSSEAYQGLDSVVLYPMTYRGGPFKEETGQSLMDLYNPLIPADGYINIAAFGPLATDKKAIQRIFEIFPDLDAVMIAYIDFNIYDGVGAMGISSKKVYAWVNVKLFNREAKRIFKLKERVSSKKGVTAVGGFVVNAEKLTPIINDAAEQLFAEMKAKIPKSLAKMAKKIDASGGEEDEG